MLRGRIRANVLPRSFFCPKLLHIFKLYSQQNFITENFSQWTLPCRKPVADTKNPFNKDAKYEARLRTWQESMERQNYGYKRTEDLIQVGKNKRAHLRDEERTLTDKLDARARSIKAEPIEIEKFIRHRQRGLDRRTAAREATLDESR